jgi:tight adherence protein C
MDLTAALPYAVFAGMSCMVWILFNVFSGKSSRADERLEEMRNPLKRLRDKDGRPVGDQSSGMKDVMDKATPVLSKALQPQSELEQSKLKLKLANAGFNSPRSSEVYLACKFAALLLGLVAGGGFGMLKYGVTQTGMYSLIIGAGLGFYIPEVILMFLVSSRKQKVFLQLPDALDLLVVCVEAGLGLDAGMRRVSEELNDSAPELCKELQLCNFQLQMGRPRREVLHDLGIRSGVDDLRSLAAILIQAEKFGSSIAQALRVQSDSMRIKRSQMAEEKAAQTAVKMIFPLVLFIFPGIFVVLVGPAAISMINNLLKING